MVGDTDNSGGYARGGAGGNGGEGIWEISVSPIQFCYESKIAQKINKVEIEYTCEILRGYKSKDLAGGG